MAGTKTVRMERRGGIKFEQHEKVESIDLEADYLWK